MAQVEVESERAESTGAAAEAAGSGDGVQNPRLPPRRPWLTLIVLVVATPLLLATLLAFFSGATWWLDLVAQTRPWLAAGLVVAGGVQLLARPKWPAAMWLAGAAAAAMPSLGRSMVSAASPDLTAPTLTLAIADAPGSPDAVALFGGWLTDGKVDVLILTGDAAATLPGFRRAEVDAQQDANVSVYVRAGTTDESFGFRYGDGPLFIESNLSFNGRPLALLAVAVPAATDGRSAAVQATAFAGIEAWTAARRFAGERTIVAGIFNTTPNGRRLRSTADRLGLTIATDGDLFAGTWPSSLPPPLRVETSNALLPKGTAATAEVGPSIGTSRRPLLVRIAAQ